MVFLWLKLVEYQKYVTSWHVPDIRRSEMLAPFHSVSSILRDDPVNPAFLNIVNLSIIFNGISVIFGGIDLLCWKNQIAPHMRYLLPSPLCFRLQYVFQIGDPTVMDVFEKIKKQGLVFDGGMGSMLIDQGLHRWTSP